MGCQTLFLTAVLFEMNLKIKGYDFCLKGDTINIVLVYLKVHMNKS